MEEIVSNKMFLTMNTRMVFCDFENEADCAVCVVGELVEGTVESRQGEGYRSVTSQEAEKNNGKTMEKGQHRKLRRTKVTKRNCMSYERKDTRVHQKTRVARGY